MSDEHAPVRSYQRIFRPDRRIYQIDGRPLPVPGGVPLTWLAWAAATLIAVLILTGRSWPAIIALAVAAAVPVATVAGMSAAAVTALGVVAGCQLLGLVLGALDWPLRLLCLPALVATVITHVAPDGRLGHRYLLSWLAHQLRPTRSSLGREIARHDLPTADQASVWVASDERSPQLRRGRVRGPARIRFSESALVAPGRRGHLRAAVPGPAMPRRLERAPLLDQVELADGERLEVVP